MVVQLKIQFSQTLDFSAFALAFGHHCVPPLLPTPTIVCVVHAARWPCAPNNIILTEWVHLVRVHKRLIVSTIEIAHDMHMEMWEPFFAALIKKGKEFYLVIIH